MNIFKHVFGIYKKQIKKELSVNGYVKALKMYRTLYNCDLKKAYDTIRAWYGLSEGVMFTDIFTSYGIKK